MKYVELKKHITERRFAPAYYLTGSDEFLRSWALKLFAAATGSVDMNYTSLENADDRQIISALDQYPIGGDLRVVALDNFPSDFERLTEYFKSPSPFSVLIVLGFPETRAAKKKQELENLKSKFTEIDCNPLDRYMLIKWIANEVTKCGCEIEQGGAELLIDYTKGDLSQISGELHKLAAYVDGGTITAGNVRTLVPPCEEYKIWELQTAVADKDRAKAMQLADKFEREKMEFVLLFGTVYKHFHNLFFVMCSDESEAISQLSLTQGNYNRLSSAAQKFGIRRLKNILYALSEIDLASKSGRLDKSLGARTMITAIIDAL